MAVSMDSLGAVHWAVASVAVKVDGRVFEMAGKWVAVSAGKRGILMVG